MSRRRRMPPPVLRAAEIAAEHARAHGCHHCRGPVDERAAVLVEALGVGLVAWVVCATCWARRAA